MPAVPHQQHAYRHPHWERIRARIAANNLQIFHRVMSRLIQQRRRHFDGVYLPRLPCQPPRQAQIARPNFQRHIVRPHPRQRLLVGGFIVGRPVAFPVQRCRPAHAQLLPAPPAYNCWIATASQTP